MKRKKIDGMTFIVIPSGRIVLKSGSHSQ